MTRERIELEGAVPERHGLRSDQQAVDVALPRLDVEPLTLEEAVAMRGRGWDGDLHELRAG